LFTDIVGYSKLPINQQRALVERLNEIVQGTDEYQASGPRAVSQGALFLEQTYGQRSGLPMRIATMESVSSCAQMKS